MQRYRIIADYTSEAAWREAAPDDNGDYVLFTDSQAQSAAYEARIKVLEAALGESIGLIETWYKMTSADDDMTWPIYYDHSPEMKRLRNALKPDAGGGK